MGLPPAVRRSPFGKHGRTVVLTFCSWEIVALLPKSPVPTISSTVKRHPSFGVTLLTLLAHHWYIEG